MSLYGSKFTIGGVPCGLVLRMGTTGKYRVTFEREYATLEQVEAICWDPPEIEGEGCILPVGYGFEVDRIEYDSNAMLFHVTVHTATQYYGDVSAYEAEVAQLQGTIREQEGTIAQQTTTISEQAAAIEEKNSTIHQQEETIQTQQNTIDSQTATIAEQENTIEAQLQEIDGRAEEMAAAYQEGVESIG